jgi:hypothetical protein
VSITLGQQFQRLATNWTADVVLRKGNPAYDQWNRFPSGPVVAILPDYHAMISYAISNHYRMVLVPATFSEKDPYTYKAEWDRATAAGILVVMTHYGSPSTSRAPIVRQIGPRSLFSAVTVGAGITNNIRTFGPGLEFFDAPSGNQLPTGAPTQVEAVPVIAAKLAHILDAHPEYNLWDARQHLRQSSSYYVSGWREDGGYGRPPTEQAPIGALDLAPPLEIQASKSADGKSVTLSWQNFFQTSFAEIVIRRKDGGEIYRGTGTNFVWRSDLDGDEIFQFFSKDRAGHLSKAESYTVIRVEGLRQN